MIQYFHHINRFVGYQYPTYTCFQTACRGGLYIRPRLPIGNATLYRTCQNHTIAVVFYR
ncbi:hypothetical protein [Neisseria montereyensis]|uniref:Uncharacterized protein n=1 Tax=Neisseria montereyensis TaxID=2973938 RepID=A0ABT2F9W0_9NEIS|nr:hypothetical protein [Neisseria montereyensis]MCS4532931.1 hypothetical protein [Neisseria montereyensis]